MFLKRRKSKIRKAISFALAVGQVLVFTGSPALTSAASLNVGDGVMVESGPSGQIVVRDTFNVGNARFTSSNPSPAPGDWKGIRIEGSASGTSINGATVEYSGGPGEASISIRKSSPSIRETTIKDNGTGIAVSGNAAPLITDSVISGNNIGIEASQGANPDISNSVFTGNGTAVINNSPGTLIQADGNWWGHPTGPKDISDDTASGGLYNPAGLGDPVSDGVYYPTYYSAIPLLGTTFSILGGSQTEGRDITLGLGCITCSEFRASESPSFTGVTFQAFSESSPFTLSLGDSLKTVYVQFRTGTGNTSGTFTDQITLDTAGPSVSLTNPANLAVVGRPLVIQASASDSAGVKRTEFYVDDALVCTDTAPPFSCNWDLSTASDGGHVITVRAYDNFEHLGASQVTVSKVRELPPVPAITVPADGSSFNLANLNISGTAEPFVNVTVFANGFFLGSAIVDSNGNFSILSARLSDGTLALTAQASDKVGTSPLSAPVNISVDTGPPPAPSSFVVESKPNGVVHIDWRSSFGELPAYYNVYRSPNPFSSTGAGVTRAASNVTQTQYDDLPAADGIYYYGATAVDAAGNESFLSTRQTGVSDRTIPSGSVTFTPPAPVGPGPVDIELQVSEALAAPPFLSITPAGGAPLALELTPIGPNSYRSSYQVDSTTGHGNATLAFFGKDQVGNRGTALSSGSALRIDTKGPAGSVLLSKAAPIGAGTVNVTLQLDESAPSAPILRFVPPSGAPLSVVLAGGGASWTGALTLPTGSGDGAGHFEMEASDALGNSGNIILAGSTVQVDTTPPPAPSGFAAISGLAGAVNLSWSPATGAAYYRVYRTPEGQPVSLPRAVTASPVQTAYSDTPSSDALYNYAVTAVDAAGNESPLSAVAQALSDRVPPGIPSGVLLAMAGTQVSVSWSAPSGEAPTSYKVYRSESPIVSVAGLASIASPQASSITDIPPGDLVYYYAITSVDGAGNESAPSLGASIAYDQAAPLIRITGVADSGVYRNAVAPAVTITDLSLASSSITLDNAPFSNGTLVSTEGEHLLSISASDTSGRSSQAAARFFIDTTAPLITFSGVVQGGSYDGPVAPVVQVADTRFRDAVINLNGQPYLSGTTISEDGAYTLEVNASDEAGNSAINSVQFSINGPPATPTGLKVAVLQGGWPEISWHVNSDADLTGYNLYRNGVKLNATPLAAPVYIDNSYNRTLSHQYRATSVDTGGLESGFAQVTVPPVSMEISRYGTAVTSGSGTILNAATTELQTSEQTVVYRLNHNYIDRLVLGFRNYSVEPVSAGPVTFEMTDMVGGKMVLSYPEQITIPADAPFEIEKIIPAGADWHDDRALSASLILPSEPGTEVKLLLNENMKVREPDRRIEIFNEPLVRGAMSKARIKVYNHGSAPMQLLTSIANGQSTDVKVRLKDVDGNILSEGNLLQKGGAGVINYSGYTLAEVEAGGSFTTYPVEFPVPIVMPDQGYIEAVVERTYYNYNQPGQVVGSRLDNQAPVRIVSVPYYASAVAGLDLYDQNQPVSITGQSLDSVTGQPVPDVDVKIGISVKGFDRYAIVRSDATGAFSYTFEPLPFEAGRYALWAVHPSVIDKPVQDMFEILGMVLNPGEANVRMSKNSTFSFPVKVRNVGESELNGFSFTLTGGSGMSGTVDASSMPAGLKEKNEGTVTVNLSAVPDAPDSSSAVLSVTNAQGITRQMQINIALMPAQPIIQSTPEWIDMAMNLGEIKTKTIQLRNVGLTSLRNIRLEKPVTPWISLSVDTVPDIPQGSTFDITVVYRPGAALDQGIFTDRLVIRSDNHIDYTINLVTTLTSSEVGGVHFNIKNTMNENVPDARFIIRHDQVSNLVFTGKTDATGQLVIGSMPKGKYLYTISAPGHQGFVGDFEVQPGSDTPVSLFLNVAFVSVEWSVTPVTIEDRYEIKLVSTFKTDVPAPVLVTDPPNLTLMMEPESTYVGTFKVTNHGLVAVKDFNIEVNSQPGLRLEALVDSFPQIPAKSSVTVPFRVTLSSHHSIAPTVVCENLFGSFAGLGNWACAAGFLAAAGAAMTISVAIDYGTGGIGNVISDMCSIATKCQADCACNIVGGLTGGVAGVASAIAQCVAGMYSPAPAGSSSLVSGGSSQGSGGGGGGYGGGIGIDCSTCGVHPEMCSGI